MGRAWWLGLLAAVVISAIAGHVATDEAYRLLWTSVGGFAMLGLFVAGFLGLQRLLKYFGGVSEAFQMYAADRVDLAGRRLEELTRAPFWPGFFYSALRIQLAAVELRRGRHRPALAILDEAATTRMWIGRALRNAAAAQSALVLAVLGEHEEASRRLAGITKRGALLLVDAVVACRRGDFEDACSILDGGMSGGQPHTGHGTRLLQLLRSYAASRGEPEGAPRVAAAEFDYLAVAWPEMRRFLERAGAREIA